MATHSSTLAWKIPWTEEPGGLQSLRSQRVGHDWATSLSFPLLCIGEGNGNPLQCSCLENPRDSGAWWAAVYGVTQSRTRLKRLSSSSSSRERWRLSGFKKYASLEKETVSLYWKFPKLEWGLLWTPETPTVTTLLTGSINGRRKFPYVCEPMTPHRHGWWRAVEPKLSMLWDCRFGPITEHLKLTLPGT